MWAKFRAKDEKTQAELQFSNPSHRCFIGLFLSESFTRNQVSRGEKKTLMHLKGIKLLSVQNSQMASGDFYHAENRKPIETSHFFMF